MKVSFVIFAIAALRGASGAAAEAEQISFSRDIRPILSQNCYKCHGADKQKGALRLDQAGSAVAPAESGKRAIVPGKPGESELIRRITTDDPNELMPQKDPRLAPQQIETLRRWIAAGGNYEVHWAYVKPVRPRPPRLGDQTATVSNPIDAYILARLRSEGVSPSPAADRYTLIRRVSLDLTGLPPTPAEVDAFVSDPSPDAYEKVVDRMLASPRYGERWARPWLDLARYSDTAGYQHDVEMPLWLYRDWVINALNADMPYDQFATEQIAGDLLPGATDAQRIATGFNRCGTATLGADNDDAELRAQLIWDRVNTFGVTWLGASLECAQCHNHKFDPFTQRDYYSLYAYFNRTERELTSYPGDHYYITGGILELPIAVAQRERLAEVRSRISAQYAEIEARVRAGRIDDYPPPIRRLLVSPAEARTPERITYLFLDELKPGQKIPADVQENVKAIIALAPELDDARAPRSLVLQEDPSPPVTHILLRGNIKTPGEALQPATPAALPPMPNDAPPNRLGLARWVASRDNPLTARVAVNRWWAEFFGAGIVPTPEDFGLQGESPTHPELLDWLAVELMDCRWSMKHIHKLIVTSGVYRQSSKVTPVLLGRDPQNRLLARGPRFRLDAEALRDNALAVSGLLQNELGGKPVAAPDAEERHTLPHRRSIYLRHQRGAPYATLTTFDAPDHFACTARRVRSNTPLQSLALLNEPAYVQCARELAARVVREMPDGSISQRVQHMFRLCLSRPPATPELIELARIHNETLASGATELDAWFLVANVLLGLDETVSKE